MGQMELWILILIFGVLFAGILYFSLKFVWLVKYWTWKAKTKKSHNRVLFEHMIKPKSAFRMINKGANPCAIQNAKYISYGNDSIDKIFWKR